MRGRQARQVLEQAGRRGMARRADGTESGLERMEEQAGVTGRRDRQRDRKKRQAGETGVGRSRQERDGWTSKRGRICRKRQAGRAGWKEWSDKQE